MNKVKDFLETNAQWLAVGIGGLWLLYMIYAHVIASSTSTVEVQGAPTPLGPAAVDDYVKTNATDVLKSAMNNKEIIKDPGVDFPGVIKDQLALVNEQPIELAGTVFRVPLAPKRLGPDPDGETIKTTAGMITKIPVVPAPTQVAAVAGKSIVMENGVQNRKLWVTVFGTIPMAELKKAFEDANVHKLNVPSAQQTGVLKVEIIREELLPDGKFGKPKPILSQQVNVPPAIQNPAFPPANQMGQELQYKGWATTNQKLIAQPPFFEVVKGDPWHKPGEVAAQVGVQAPPAAPVAPATPPTPPRRPTNPTRPPGGTGPRPPANGPRNNNLKNPTGMISPANLQATETNVLQVFGEQPIPGQYPGAAPAAGAVPAGPVPMVNQLGEAPAVLFEPQHALDIYLWVHDVEVESGKTYQYKMRYTIANPVYTYKNLVPKANPQWAQQFSIDSALSTATDPVQIPDTTSYFLAAANVGRADAKFDIFVWGVTGVVRTTVPATPGDLVDENLKLTLVDVRDASNNDQIAILVDENGNLIRRSRKDDDKNPIYKALRDEAANAAPRAATP